MLNVYTKYLKGVNIQNHQYSPLKDMSGDILYLYCQQMPWKDQFSLIENYDCVCVCDLTGRIVDGDVGVFGVSVVRHGEHAGVAARVLRVFGVHQPQGAVSERDPEAVQLHVVVPGRRGDAVPRLAVVGEDVGGVLAVGEAPVEEGVVQVRRGVAGDGQVSPLSSSYF